MLAIGERRILKQLCNRTKKEKGKTKQCKRKRKEKIKSYKNFNILKGYSK